MPLVTGQTWFSVPKTVNLRLINKPPKGIGGKDTILYILKEFKRNTIAADRVVEFTGPGLKYLSCDARFAIANMCTVSPDLAPDKIRIDRHRNSEQLLAYSKQIVGLSSSSTSDA